MKPCGPHTSPLPWGSWWGGRKDWDLPPQSFSEGHTVSKWWSQDENGPPLLAPRPLHDSELVSEARRLGKVSFAYLESSAFCFPFKSSGAS